MSQQKDALGANVAKIYMHFLFLPKVFSLSRENNRRYWFGSGIRIWQLTTGNWQLLNPL
jgi:hypothetical protein